MNVLPHKQGTTEWKAARRGIPTASEFAPFMIEKPKCRLQKLELQALLAADGVDFKKGATNDELIALLPDVKPFLSLTETAAKARAEYIAAKLTEAMDNDEYEQEAEDKADRFLERDPWIKRGKYFEPFARAALASRLDREIVETGLILHASGGFAASPDGLIVAADGDGWQAGAEIKCHNRKRHLAELLANKLPDDHRFQVHGGMAVTGLREWHYWAFHPKLPSHHVIVQWDEFTQELHDGLMALSAEIVSVREKLSALYAEQEAEIKATHERIVAFVKEGGSKAA